MLDFIRDGASRREFGRKMETSGIQFSVLTEIHGVSDRYFKVVAKIYSSPVYFCSEF